MIELKHSLEGKTLQLETDKTHYISTINQF